MRATPRTIPLGHSRHSEECACVCCTPVRVDCVHHGGIWVTGYTHTHEAIRVLHQCAAVTLTSSDIAPLDGEAVVHCVSYVRRGNVCVCVHIKHRHRQRTHAPEHVHRVAHLGGVIDVDRVWTHQACTILDKMCVSFAFVIYLKHTIIFFTRENER